MTQNVVSYLTQQEGKRANLAREKETSRHNTVAESLQDWYNKESQRHNYEVERQGRVTLEEQARHNKAMEMYNNRVAAETARANQANEMLTAWNRQIQQRQVAEQARANTLQHEATLRQVAYSYDQLAETNRSNRARELNSQMANRNTLTIGMANSAVQNRNVTVQENLGILGTAQRAAESVLNFLGKGLSVVF